MSMQSLTGANGPAAMRPPEDRQERARIVASFAEYLAEDVHGHPDRALDAMAALAEWCDDDPQLLQQAHADLVRDTRRARLSAQAVVAQNNRDAPRAIGARRSRFLTVSVRERSRAWCSHGSIPSRRVGLSPDRLERSIGGMNRARSRDGALRIEVRAT